MMLPVGVTVIWIGSPAGDTVLLGYVTRAALVAPEYFVVHVQVIVVDTLSIVNSRVVPEVTPTCSPPMLTVVLPTNPLMVMSVKADDRSKSVIPPVPTTMFVTCLVLPYSDRSRT